MATQFANFGVPTSGCLFYLNFGDRNCHVSGSFTGSELINRNTITFQNQIGYTTEANGNPIFTAVNRGLNGTASIAVSPSIFIPNQHTHIMVTKRNDIAYESIGYYSVNGPTTTSGLGFSAQRAIFNSNLIFTGLFNSTNINNSTDWFFLAGRSELVGSSWTQSLFTRGFLSGTRIFETNTTNANFITVSGSMTSFSIATVNLNTPIGLIMIYNRPLPLSEINQIYDSIKFRFNLPRE